MSLSPKVLAPDGSCDCHFHVFGPEPKYPYSEPRSYTPPDASLNNYLAFLTRLNISKCVLVQPSVYGVDNRLLLDTMKSLGEKARAVAVVDEDISSPELEKMHSHGVRGLRFNLLFKGGVDLSKIKKLAPKVSHYGWHFQFLLDVKDLLDMEVHLKNLAIPIVFDHMGHMNTSYGINHPGFQKLISLLKEGNTWVKISGAYRISQEGSPYNDVAPFVQELVKAAPERCLWGSDWPHPSPPGSPPDSEELFYLLYEWTEDKKLVDRILIDNANNLYFS